MEKGSYEENVKDPLKEISGILIGDNLLPAVKAAMLVQPVFQKLFGKDGERIAIKQLPSYNDTIIPLIEFRWGKERWQSQHNRIYATVIGRIILPADLDGHVDRFRSIVAAFMRWIESKHTLFADVSGLIEFGTDADFKYDEAFRSGGDIYPIIDFILPVVFDLTIFAAENPEIDLDGALDADLYGWIETYRIKVRDENAHVLIDTNVLSKTGQTNDGQ